MTIDGIIVESRQYERKDGTGTGHIMAVLAQQPTGEIGVIKHFCSTAEQRDKALMAALIGSVVELDCEEEKKGFSTYMRSKSVALSSKTAILTFDE